VRPGILKSSGNPYNLIAHNSKVMMDEKSINNSRVMLVEGNNCRAMMDEKSINNSRVMMDEKSINNCRVKLYGGSINNSSSRPNK
jgi:coenzyme F420-reducing hydrogenase gamma subunit